MEFEVTHSDEVWRWCSEEEKGFRNEKGNLLPRKKIGGLVELGLPDVASA